MTRGQYHEHLAKQRMRALRGETTKPQGAHGDLNMLAFGGRDAVTGRAVETCCNGCGHHVCSCKRPSEEDIKKAARKITERVNRYFAGFVYDALRPLPAEPLSPVVGYAVADSVPQADGTHSVTVDLGPNSFRGPSWQEWKEMFRGGY